MRTFLFLLFTFALALFLALALGSTPLHFSDLFIPGSNSQRIFLELRLPRALFVVITGGSLAAIGIVYQVLFHNPLAEPFILGVSNVVTLGLVACEVFAGVSSYGIPAQMIAVALSLTYTILLVWLTARTREGEESRIILFGMGSSFVFSSLLFLLLSYHFQQMGGGGSLRWLFGQMQWAGWNDLAFIAIVTTITMVVLWIFGRNLDAVGLGDSVSRTLGVDPLKTRSLSLGITSIFLSLLVAKTGIIGFVGLVVPHLVRLLFGPSTVRVFLCLSFALGGIFLLAADTASRILLPPYEFPIGIITAILGGPLFLYLLWKR